MPNSVQILRFGFLLWVLPLLGGCIFSWNRVPVESLNGVPGPDTAAPTTGTALSFSLVSTTEMTVNWGSATDDISDSSNLQYKLVMSTSSQDIDSINKVEAITGSNLLLDWTTGTTTKAVSGLTAITTYFFAVLVRDAAGNRALYEVASQMTAPDAPTGLAVVTGVTATSLSWTATTGATSYNLYWKTSSGVSKADNKIASVTSPYSHTSLTAGTTYYYVVTAANGGGESAVSSEVNELVLSSGTTWAQEAYIKASNAEAGDRFGIVAVNRDTIAVGAVSEDSNQTGITNGTSSSTDNSAADSGAVYVYRRNGTTWAQEAYIKPSNLEAGDQFHTVEIRGDLMVASSETEDSNQTTITSTGSSDNSALDAGAAFVFRRTGTTWVEEAYLKASNAEAGDGFGQGIGVYDDTVAISAWGEDSNQTTITNGSTSSGDNSASTSGSVYIFRKTGATWAQEAYIKAPNAEANDSLGNHISLYENTLAVGAFVEDSNQTTITNGTTASADNSALNSGAAYVFKRSGTTWAQEAYIKAPNAEAGDYLGVDVEVFKDTLIAGATGEDSNQTTITNGTTASADNSAAECGAAYIFKRTGTVWAQEAYLKAPNSGAGDSFGFSVALSHDTAVVGAGNEDSNQTTITNGTTASADNSAANSGAAYVFKRSGTTWAQEAYLKAPNSGAGDQFGLDFAVATSYDTAVIGAQYEDSNQTTITNGTSASADNSAADSGAVYVFRRN